MNLEPNLAIADFQSASAQMADVLGLFVQTPLYGVVALLIVGGLAVWKGTLLFVGLANAGTDYSWWAKRQRRQAARELGVPNNRTAVLIYVANHDLETVISNVQWMMDSTCQALQEIGRPSGNTSPQRQPIDFFVLSDTAESDRSALEQASLSEVQAKYESSPCRLFYQHRSDTEAGRLGFIREFSAKLGTQYPYLVPLNAGTVISGTSLVHSIFQIDRDAGLAAVQFSRLPMRREPWTGDSGARDRGLSRRGSSRLQTTVETPGTIFEQWGIGCLFPDRMPLSFDGCVVRSSAFLQNSKLPKYPWTDFTPSPQHEIQDQSISALMGLAGWKRQSAPAIDQAHHALPYQREFSLTKVLAHDDSAVLRNTQAAANTMGLVCCEGIDWSDRWLLSLDVASKLKCLWWSLVGLACVSLLWHEGAQEPRTKILLKLTVVIASLSYLPRLLEVLTISFAVWRTEQGWRTSYRQRSAWAAAAILSDIAGVIWIPRRAGMHLWCLVVYCLHSAATRMGHRGRFACYIRAAGGDQPAKQVGWLFAAIGLWLATGNVWMPSTLLGLWLLTNRLRSLCRASQAFEQTAARLQKLSRKDQQDVTGGFAFHRSQPVSRRLDECQVIAQQLRQARPPSVLRFDEATNESNDAAGQKRSATAKKSALKQPRSAPRPQTPENDHSRAEIDARSAAPAAKLR